MIGKTVITGLLLLLGSAAAAQQGPAGRYRLTGEQDVASELVLRTDGSFEYFLIAGALDEHATGRWTMEGKRLRLVTEPKPVPPVFSVSSVAKTNEAPLKLHVRWPNGRGIAGIDLQVGFDTGDVVEGYTQEYGWSLPSDETRKPRWVILSVPMHRLKSGRFPIDAATSNALTFTLTPNDLGVVDFQDLVIEVAHQHLVVHRDGARLSYIKSVNRR